MAGMDANTTEVHQREAFAFSNKQAKHLLTELLQYEGINGAILLSTCNRTELYLSTAEHCQIAADALLQEYALFPVENPVIQVREEEEAALHLMEVACGIHSRILHEEQIVTQIGESAAFARACHTTDAMLDTLFRIAVSAGKYALTHISVAAVPLSVSYQAIQCLEKSCDNLSGKKCVVIGNGKMGRLVAELLVQKHCEVYVTLRTYHHGETIIPFGTRPIPYEARYAYIDGADIVCSATRSPHFTITAEQFSLLHKKPRWILDLALPRDVEPACVEEGVTLYNIDHFEKRHPETAEAIQQLYQTAKQYAQEFQMWRNYRDSMPYIQQVKRLTAQRLLHSTVLGPYREEKQLEELVCLVSEKTVDMLLDGMKSAVAPDLLQACCEKIRARARALPK